MTHSRVGLVCAFALLCVIGCSAPAAASAAGIIVRRDPGLNASERAAVRADAGVSFERKMLLPDTEVVTVPDGEQAAALAKLDADPDVRFAVPDARVKIAGASPTPDELFSRQWALQNDGPSTMYPTALLDADIDAPDAWNVMEGQGITVAVVDQQVYATHPDLAGNVEPGRDFIPDDDGCKAPTPSGFFDHGTLVSGVVAAQRNMIGVAGVAPLAHIRPLRAIDDCGFGDLDWVIDAFTFAGQEQIPVVTASFGTDPLKADPAKYNQAFLDVFEAYPNTLYVVAAGNEGVDIDDNKHAVYPCSTRGEGQNSEVTNLLCVGATDNQDSPVCWGNVGPGSVDLFAPGVSILSTARGANPYVPRSGTSMAAPMVAAAAAVLLSIEPRPSVKHVAQKLLDESDVKTELVQLSASGGRLNVARAADAPGRLGGGPESMPWKSCDRDHDGVRDDTGLDQCPDAPGADAMRGCPDSDGDGISDATDNCRTMANADQTDSDSDRVGNLCDAAPRGDDPDGDSIPSMDDRCPDEAGVPPDGCAVVGTPPGPGPSPTPIATPTVAPEPVVVTLEAKVSKCKKGKKCKKVAKVTVKLSREGKVALKVERQDRKRGRLVWTRVKSQSLTANARGKTLTVRGKSAQRTSKYRVTATFAGKAKAVSFKV